MLKRDRREREGKRNRNGLIETKLNFRWKKDECTDEDEFHGRFHRVITRLKYIVLYTLRRKECYENVKNSS